MELATEPAEVQTFTAAAHDLRPPMATEPPRARTEVEGVPMASTLTWPRAAPPRLPSTPCTTPLSREPMLAMEAASGVLMYSSVISEFRRNPSMVPPTYSTVTVRSLAMEATAEGCEVKAAWEKPKLTPTRLLMAVLLNLVDCINMNILTPYAAEMVAKLLDKEGQVNDPEVLRQVGLLIGVYNVSEMLFSPGWGRLSDRFGRRPVILVSLGGAMLVPILFGLSRSMGMALAVRAVNGVLCGSIGITKTYVAELVDKENEAWAFSILTTVYSVGMILGPVMGGMLVSPAKWSPAAERFFAEGVWRMFRDEPFLLPNLVFSLLAMTVWVLAFFFLKESLPREQRQALQEARAAAQAEKLEAQRAARLEGGSTPGQGCGNAWKCIAAQLPFVSYPARLLRAIMAYGLAVGYVISTVQNIILLYQIPVRDGGFELGPERLGMLQNFAALGLLVTQLCLYPKLVQLQGYRWCVAVGLGCVLVVTLPMPVYGLMHDPAEFGAWRMVPVVLMMVIQQAAFGFCTPTSIVWINRFAEGMDRGEVNGWANSFAALCRALAPMAVGLLQGLGSSLDWRGGQYLALYTISLLALAIAALLLPVLPKGQAFKSVKVKEEAERKEDDREEGSSEGTSEEDQSRQIEDANCNEAEEQSRSGKPKKLRSSSQEVAV